MLFCYVVNKVTIQGLKMIILKLHNKGGHSREVLHGALWWLFEETLKLITGPLKTRHKKGQEQGYYYFIICFDIF